MSLLFIDGFDHYQTTDLGLKWTIYTGNSALSPTIGAYGRFSTNGVKLNSAYQRISRPVGTHSAYIVGFAVYITTLPPSSRFLVGLIDGTTNQTELTINTTGTISLTRGGSSVTGGTSIAALPVGAWSFVEWLVTPIASSSGSDNILKFNGTTVLTIASGVNCKSTSNASADTVYIGAVNLYSGYEFHFDDFYILSTTGTYNNTWISDCRVETVIPDSDAAASGASRTGGSSNNAVMSEIPNDGDTSYVSWTSSTSYVNCGVSSLASTPSSIPGIQVVATAKKTENGVANLGLLVGPVTGLQSGLSPVGLSTSYTMVSVVSELNLATSAAWAAGDIASANLCVQGQ